jgi:hypothetical protein
MTIDYAARYAEAKSEFDTVLKYAIDLSLATGGRPVTSDREEDACLIFAKIAGHAVSVARLLPTGLPPQQAQPKEFWDLSSICALVRALVDSYYALAYIAGEEIPDAERQFRRLVWGYHAECRRLHLLELIGSQAPEVAEIAQKVQRLRTEIQGHPFLSTLPQKVASEIVRGERAYHLAHSELNGRLYIDHDYYRAAYVFLSSYVHAYPFSLSQLAAFRAGEGKSLHLIALAVQYCTGFLGLSMLTFQPLVSGEKPLIPADVKRVVDEWAFTISNGVRKPV